MKSPSPTWKAFLNNHVRDVESQHVAGLLAQHHGNRRLVAEALGISERTLYRKLKKYHLG